MKGTLPMLLGLVLLACACAPKPDPEDPSLAGRLARWMSGSFRAQDEVRSGRSAETLRSVTPLWVERADGPWLYVEHVDPALPNRAEERHVLHPRALEGDVDRLTCEWFALPLELAQAARSQAAAVESLGPDALIPLPGCALQLIAIGEASFVGANADLACSSTRILRGFVTRSLVVTRDRTECTTRQFDETGASLWGDGVSLAFERVD